jgi:hypothetical protein
MLSFMFSMMTSAVLLEGRTTAFCLPTESDGGQTFRLDIKMARWLESLSEGL